MGMLQCKLMQGNVCLQPKKPGCCHAHHSAMCAAMHIHWMSFTNGGLSSGLLQADAEETACTRAERKIQVHDRCTTGQHEPYLQKLILHTQAWHLQWARSFAKGPHVAALGSKGHTGFQAAASTLTLPVCRGSRIWCQRCTWWTGLSACKAQAIAAG